MSSKITILDCTLRDGGYYNNWDFDSELVSFYIAAMENAKIDAIEIGFRILDNKEFYGPYAYSTDEFLSSLKLPEKVLIGVMINAKDILNYKDGVEKAIHHLFKEKSSSPVSLVRIAAHFSEVEKCGTFVKILKKLGYRLGFNLMQSGGKSSEEITKAAKIISDWDCIEVLYFADSLGNMTTCDIVNTREAISRSWDGPIGFHSHDNMGLGLSNSLKAIDVGISWLDATVLGMGRGAGNVRTELLLIELAKNNISTYFPEAIFPIALEHFEELKKKYGWGMNLLYYLSASKGIHPTYVQEILQNTRFEPHHMISAIEFLEKNSPKSFSTLNLERAVLSRQGKGNAKGGWSASGWAKDRDLLIVAPGPGTKRHLDAILSFIERKRPLVICLNANSYFPESKIDAYAACHQARLLLDSDLLQNLSKPLIAPLSSIPQAVKRKFKNITIYDYGLEISPNAFVANENGCILPTSLVAGYVFALAVASGAKRMLLAGFDGFSVADPRHVDMQKILLEYKNSNSNVPLIAVTPTAYSIDSASIYSPDL